MTKGVQWAAGIASGAGCLLWAMGALLHVIYFQIVLHYADALSGFRHALADWMDVLLLAGGFVLVVLVTAAGGGLRFFAGLMRGQKVVGTIGGQILFYHWLRYELFALAITFAFGSPFLMTLRLANSIRVLLMLAGFGVAVLGLIGGLWCGLRSARLMWKVREVSIGTGMVPYPADAVRPRKGAT